MTAALPDAALTLIASCEGSAGSDRALGIIVPPLIVAVWAWITWQVLVRGTDDSERFWLFCLMAVTALTGWVVFQSAEGDHSGGAYRESFQLSLLVAAAIGASGSLLLRRFGVWRGVAAAIAGDVILPGGLVLLFIWGLSVSGGCID